MATEIINLKDAPPPGIYPDISQEEYSSWNAIRSSDLHLLSKSPKHLHHGRTTRKVATPAMLLGTCVHAMVFEPGKVEDLYTVAPCVDKRTKEGKATWAAFTETNAGKTIMDGDDFQKAENIQLAVADHPQARNLLDNLENRELSVVWVDEATSMLCKARPDGICNLDGTLVVVDLKTTIDASVQAFQRSLFSYGYYRQVSHYLEGLKANGIEVEDFVFICAETTEPHAVVCRRLDDEAIQAGRMDRLNLLKRYKQCISHDEYPGYNDHSIESVSLPNWAWYNIAI